MESGKREKSRGDWVVPRMPLKPGIREVRSQSMAFKVLQKECEGEA